MTRTITVGPFAAFFTNVNTAMKLAGHSHFATVELEFETLGDTGFPAFADTYAAVQQHIGQHTEKPFRDCTNEGVADRLFEAFRKWTHPSLERWGGSFELCRLTLGVRGVPDRIGHADGFTYYTVRT